MSKSELEQLETLTKPLANLLREKHNPHCQIIIDSDRVRIVEDVVGVPVREGGNLQLKVDVDTKEVNESIRELTAAANECVEAFERLEKVMEKFGNKPVQTFNLSPVVKTTTGATEIGRMICRGTQI